MPGPDHSTAPETCAGRNERTAAALALAGEIRNELMRRPLPPPEPCEQPIYRLVQFIKPASFKDPREKAGSSPPPPRVRPEGTEGTRAIRAEELKRLQRIVNMLTTAAGELNLWLANAGQEPVEIEP